MLTHIIYIKLVAQPIGPHIPCKQNHYQQEKHHQVKHCFAELTLDVRTELSVRGQKGYEHQYIKINVYNQLCVYIQARKVNQQKQTAKRHADKCH